MGRVLPALAQRLGPLFPPFLTPVADRIFSDGFAKGATHIKLAQWGMGVLPGCAGCYEGTHGNQVQSGPIYAPHAALFRRIGDNVVTVVFPLGRVIVIWRKLRELLTMAQVALESWGARCSVACKGKRRAVRCAPLRSRSKALPLPLGPNTMSTWIEIHFYSYAYRFHFGLYFRSLFAQAG